MSPPNPHATSLSILWLATKAPWPAVDGGRLLMANTIEGLCARGHRVTVLAPYEGALPPSAPPSTLRALCRLVSVPVRRPPKLWHGLVGQLRGLPWTIVRHRPKALRRRLADLLRYGDFDLLQAEQVQAWGALQGVTRGPIPALWRAQNVESDLWAGIARSIGGPLGAYAGIEARRLARFEAAAVRSADGTLALTRHDGERLAQLSGRPDRVHTVAAPFGQRLPSAEAPLGGEPALVLLGSQGWRPNRDGARWFVETVWPRLRQAWPQARLHVFGALSEGSKEASPAGVELQPSPADSRQAFAPGSILVVPLDVASGIRMKILEAWARGIPVIATGVAARGLEATDGEQLFIADDAGAFAKAVAELAKPPRRRQMVLAARRHLRRQHDQGAIAEQLERLYRRVLRPG